MIKYEEITHAAMIPFKIFSFRAKNLDRIIAPHWHQSTEILFVKEGTLKITLQNKTYLLHKNEFVVINPNIIHSTRSLSKNWVLCIQLPLSFLKLVTNNQFDKVFIFKDINFPTEQEASERIIALFNQAIYQTENHPKNIQYFLDLYSSGLLILKELISSYSVKVNKNNADDKSISILSKAIDYININYSKSITLTDMAKFLGYSPSYCSKVIKKNLGTNFKEILDIIRLEKVVLKAQKGKRSLEQIAQETGFKTYRNLYNAFYSVYGMSPKQFLSESM